MLIDIEESDDDHLEPDHVETDRPPAAVAGK